MYDAYSPVFLEHCFAIEDWATPHLQRLGLRFDLNPYFPPDFGPLPELSQVNTISIEAFVSHLVDNPEFHDHAGQFSLNMVTENPSLDVDRLVRTFNLADESLWRPYTGLPTEDLHATIGELREQRQDAYDSFTPVAGGGRFVDPAAAMRLGVDGNDHASRWMRMQEMWAMEQEHQRRISIHGSDAGPGPFGLELINGTDGDVVAATHDSRLFAAVREYDLLINPKSPSSERDVARSVENIQQLVAWHTDDAARVEGGDEPEQLYNSRLGISQAAVIMMGVEGNDERAQQARLYQATRMKIWLNEEVQVAPFGMQAIIDARGDVVRATQTDSFRDDVRHHFTWPGFPAEQTVDTTITRLRNEIGQHLEHHSATLAAGSTSAVSADGVPASVQRPSTTFNENRAAMVAVENSTAQINSIMDTGAQKHHQAAVVDDTSTVSSPWKPRTLTEAEPLPGKAASLSERLAAGGLAPAQPRDAKDTLDAGFVWNKPAVQETPYEPVAPVQQQATNIRR